MKKLLILLVSFLLVFALTTSGYAIIIFNDWTLDLNGIEGQTSQITDINQILFHGIGWSQTSDQNNNNVPDGGDIGSTDGLLDSIIYRDTFGSTKTWGPTLELTFDFSFNSLLTDPVGSGWTHLAAGTVVPDLQTDGFLDIYVDDTTFGAGVAANATTGEGYADGTQIARFEILGGDGGSFDLSLYDGHDDGTFKLLWALPGVFKDKAGNSLTDPSNTEYNITITDSNFDGDEDDDTVLNTIVGTSVFSPSDPQTVFDFLATQDGSGSMGSVVIPEPATFLLFSIGLMSIVGISRKKPNCYS